MLRGWCRCKTSLASVYWYSNLQQRHR